MVMNNYLSKKRFVISFKADGVLQFTFSLFLYATIITDFVRKGIFVGWIPSGIPVLMIRNVIYAICLFPILYDAIKNRKEIILLALLLAGLGIISVSYLLTPSISTLIPDTLLLFVSRFIPAFYLFFYNEKWDERINTVVKWRWILYAYFALAAMNYVRLAGGYMEIAYNLLCPVLIVTYYAVVNKKRLMIISMIIINLFIVFFGSRGAMFCVLLSAVSFFILTYHKMQKRERIISIAVLILLFISLIISYTTLFDFLSTKLSFTRNIQQILDGTFFTDRSASVRMRMYDLCLNEVSAHPLTIRGMLSDRVLLTGTLSVGVSGGYYAHNFVVEILYQFGALFGGLIVLWLLIATIKSYINISRIHNDSYNIIFSSCVAAIIPYMMLSGSYLTEAVQWMLFGYVAMMSKKVRKNRD